MGMFLDDSAESGARVVKVQDFSFAQVTGIREGDIIVAVNGREFQRAGGFERELASLQGIISKPWSFQIIRMGGTLFLEPPYKCHPPVLTACGPVPIEMDK
jgi:S1-C subfamily serine protease